MVIVKVTLVVLLLIPVFVTEHTPLELVVQVAVPVAPFVHLPVTVAFATNPSDVLCILIVTVAFHFIPESVAERSRSPTCKVVTDKGVDVNVAVGKGVDVNVASGNGVDVYVGLGRDVDVNVGAGVAVFVGPGVGVGFEPVQLKAARISRRPYPNTSSGPETPKSTAELIRARCWSITDRFGNAESSRASPPATCGAAYDVPENALVYKPYKSDVLIFTPGATSSG